MFTVRVVAPAAITTEPAAADPQPAADVALAQFVAVLQEDTTRGAVLAFTCNTTVGRTYMVTARSLGTSFLTARNLGTSFTITASAAAMIDPACLSYHIIN